MIIYSSQMYCCEVLRKGSLNSTLSSFARRIPRKSLVQHLAAYMEVLVHQHVQVVVFKVWCLMSGWSKGGIFPIWTSWTSLGTMKTYYGNVVVLWNKRPKTPTVYCMHFPNLKAAPECRWCWKRIFQFLISGLPAFCFFATFCPIMLRLTPKNTEVLV